jgi:hypothetical protein
MCSFISILWILSINFFKEALNWMEIEDKNLNQIPGTNPVSDFAAQHGFHKLIGQNLTVPGNSAPVGKTLRIPVFKSVEIVSIRYLAVGELVDKLP